MATAGRQPGVSATGPSVGELFAGRYRIEALIGRGGMGSVYRAHDREVDEHVALKTLDGDDVGDKALERFRREVRLARRVTHRNAARTYDLGEHQGQRFLTMELVEGESLRRWLRRRPGLSPILEVAIQICAGLGAAHQAEVVHRDLKPSNILIDRSGRAVITDFGIARLSQELTASQTNSLLGTPAYMAPEQVEAKPTTPRTDLYALGLILYEMLTGELPFAGDNPIAVAMARIGREVSLEHPAIPVAIAPILASCLAADPQQRAASAEAIAGALAAVRSTLPEDPTPLLPLAEPDPPATAPATVGSGLDTGLGTGLGTGLDAGLAGLGSARPGGGHRIEEAQTQVSLVPAATGGPSRVPSAPFLSSSAPSSASSGTPSGRPATTDRGTATPGRSSKALALLPFRYRGPADADYLADAMLDELTDLLSMTRGLKVTGTGATSRYTDAGDRDPRTSGAELGVDVIVDGTIALNGQRLRIAARLLDVDDGFQLWSERFDGQLADVFELQDRMCKRIAEALRVELELHGHDGLHDPELVACYFRARQAKLRWRMHGRDGAIAYYRQVLAAAPDFKPALAGLAFAMVRGGFLPEDDGIDWPRETKQAVERALVDAPELAETQVAAAAWSIQQADFRSAALQLRQALRIAPTCAIAHEYLGRLQIEGPQPERGREHLELAYELDSALDWCLGDLARYQALRGDLQAYDALMERFYARADRNIAAGRLHDMRVGAWYRDLDRIRQALIALEGAPNDRTAAMIRRYGPALLAPYDAAALDAEHAMLGRISQNSRLTTYLAQLAAEQTAFHGDLERALGHLRRAADLVLTDLDWLDHCPLFATIRDDPRFVQLRALVLERCNLIWT